MAFRAKPSTVAADRSSLSARSVSTHSAKALWCCWESGMRAGSRSILLLSGILIFASGFLYFSARSRVVALQLLQMGPQFQSECCTRQVVTKVALRSRLSLRLSGDIGFRLP